MMHNNKTVINIHKTKKLLAKKTTSTNKSMLALLNHLMVELSKFSLIITR